MVRDAMLEDYFLHLYDEFKARMGPVSQYCTGSLKRQLCLARFPLCEASTAPGSEPAHLQYCFAKVFPGETGARARGPCAGVPLTDVHMSACSSPAAPPVTVCAPRADKMQIVCLNAPWGRTCVRANDCVFLGGQTDFDTDHCNETFVRTERCFFERAQSNRTSETARYFSAAPGDGSALLANSTLLHKWHSEWEEHVDAPPADEGSRPSASHPATADPLVARIVAGLLVAGMLAFMAVKLWGVVAPPLRGMLYGRAGFQPVGAGQAELVGDDADA